MKRTLFIGLIAACLSWIACIRTDGFSLASIEGSFPAEKALPASPEVQQVLSQPFHYLSKGRQCFVFQSADGKYVLKFFNQNYLRVPWYAFSRKKRAKRVLRRHFYETSYEIAHREFGEEIFYLHLGPSEELPTLTLTDRAKREYLLDLNRFPFVLQRKGIPFYAVLEGIYEEEGLPGLYREIDAFLAQISVRISKHIADADIDVENNWGYVDGKIFHLDPGRLYYEERLADPHRVEQEWRTATHRFHKWLKTHYPEAALYLEGSTTAYLFRP